MSTLAIEAKSWAEGEIRVCRTEKVKLTVTADATPMVNGDLDEECFKEINEKGIPESSVSEGLKTKIEMLALRRRKSLMVLRFNSLLPRIA